MVNGRRIHLDPKALRQQYLRGQTLDELARSYGVSADTIRDRLLEARVTLRSTGIRPGDVFIPLDSAQLLKDFQAGVSMLELAAWHNTNRETIRRRIREAEANADPKRRRSPRPPPVENRGGVDRRIN